MTDNQIPQGWTKATIGDLISSDGVFIDGDWVESKDQDPNGDVRLIQLADIGDGQYLNRSSRFLTSEKAGKLRCTFMQPGDVLIARMPDPLGRTCIFPGDPRICVTVVDVCIVRSGTGGVNQRWLMYTVNSPEFRLAISELQSGSTRKRISRGNLATLFLPVPPLPEQHRIVEEIEKQFSRLDEAVANLKRVQANLKRYRASVLQAACEGRLVPTEAELAQNEGRDYEPADQLLQRILIERRRKWEENELAKMREKGKEPKDDNWKLRYKEPVAPDMSELPRLPNGWCWAQLSTIADVRLGKMLSPKAQEAGLIRLPYLRNENIRWGHIEFHDLKEMGFKESEIDRYQVQCGDLLVCEGGEPGRCAVYQGVGDQLMYQKALHRIRTYGAIVAPSLVQFCFQHYVSAKIVVPRASQTTIQHLPLEKIVVLPMPIPPKAEQERLVSEVERRLSVIEQMESAVEMSLKRADRLRQAILKRAFEGKLVPQDPDDEPAGVLLERTRVTEGCRDA